jgi:hypothetical protein
LLATLVRFTSTRRQEHPRFQDQCFQHYGELSTRAQRAGGTGNDFVDIVFDDVFSSALTVLGRQGRHRQIDARNKIGPNKVTMATTNGDGQSSVLVDFDLGTKQSVSLPHGWRRGHLSELQDSAGRRANCRQPEERGRRQRDRRSRKSSVDTANNLAFHIDLFAGNDKFEGIFRATWRAATSARRRRQSII